MAILDAASKRPAIRESEQAGDEIGWSGLDPPEKGYGPLKQCGAEVQVLVDARPVMLR